MPSHLIDRNQYLTAAQMAARDRAAREWLGHYDATVAWLAVQQNAARIASHIENRCGNGVFERIVGEPGYVVTRGSWQSKLLAAAENFVGRMESVLSAPDAA